MEYNFDFKNIKQEQYFYERARNQCFSGGFQNGKTFVGCLKHFYLGSSFPKYRSLIGRQFMPDLRDTTMKTFFKICPPDFIETHNLQLGITVLKNKSEILWKHLDDCDEQSLRGLEINSALLDQAEEIAEDIYLVLDSRIGRWDKAVVPDHLLTPNWPKTELGNYKVPTYMSILCNPDTQYHWIYRRYHPDSLARCPNHVMIQAETDPNLGDPETVSQMLTRDPVWVRKYYKGEWGISDAQIHQIKPNSLLEYSPELINLIKEKGALYRILDHGDTSPTCCLWIAVVKGVFIVYREYYYPRGLISGHRQNIQDLSGDEHYQANYADPSIFKLAPKQSARNSNNNWTVADEYLTSDIDAPSLVWIPADNNELATRNRINELLSLHEGVRHPITGETPAPKLYFIKRTNGYTNGCYHSIIETEAQRRVKLGSENGLDIYGDEREDSIVDHAYDCVRYFVAMHGSPLKIPKRRPPRKSFAYFEFLRKKRLTEEHLSNV